MAKNKMSAAALAMAAAALKPISWASFEPTKRYSQFQTAKILRQHRHAGKRGTAPRPRPVNKWHKKPRRAFLVIRANHSP